MRRGFVAAAVTGAAGLTLGLMPVSGAFATSLPTGLPQTDWCSDSRYGEWSACCDPARGNYRPGWCWDNSGRNEGNWRDASWNDPNWSNWNNWNNWNDGRYDSRYDDGWRDGGWNNGGNGGWNDDWHDGGHGYDGHQGNWHDGGYRSNWHD